MGAVQEFFEGLPTRVTPDRIEGMNNTYVFDIEGAGVWTVAIADGGITVNEGAGDADCTFCDERGELREDRRGRAEPDHGVHDGQAEDQGRHGRGHEAPEDLLVRTDRAETTMIWVALLVRWGINTLALIVIDWMFSGVEIGRWGSLLFAAAILTIGNTIIKPILAILTLPLIILTFGLAYFAINVLMLALAEWLTPNFSIDGFWTYVGATIVVWLVNVSVGWFLDRVREQ